jgi:hypothetical protein
MIHGIKIVTFALVTCAGQLAAIVAPVLLDTGAGIGDAVAMGAGGDHLDCCCCCCQIIDIMER